MILLLISFVFNDTATTEIYTYLHTLSLHDALPISRSATISPGATARSTPRKTSIVSSPWMKLRRRPATLRTSFIAKHLDRIGIGSLEGGIKRCKKADRKSVVEGKSVSVRVDLGGRRIIKKPKTQKKYETEYKKT